MARTTPPRPSAFLGPDHNHGACLTATLARARAAFEAKGLRLTEQRLAVLSEIAASHHAIGAYDVIDQLGAKGTRLAPVSVYRAIEALIAVGSVHRLESSNAYFACHAPHADQTPHVVLSCGSCQTIAEVAATDVFGALDQVAARHAFAASMRIVEVAGLCARCTAQERA
jgi:Fur family transcriptional regulator, zinc uptake regulator